METSTLIIMKDVVVGIAALVGMLFGIYNFLIERHRDKVNLKVIPKIAGNITQSLATGNQFIMSSSTKFPIEDDISHIAIEAINLSPFNVTANGVGFIIKGSKDRLAIPNPIVGDKKDWPRKLESRESVTVYGNFKELLNHKNAQDIKYAYVTTTCGKTIKGTSKVLKAFAKHAKSIT